MVKEVKRNHYLNLFSVTAEITTKRELVNNVMTNTKNTTLKWNTWDLQLRSQADIALVKIIHTCAANNTGCTFRMLETYAVMMIYNQISAIVFMGVGMNQISVPTYHKLISDI